MRAEDGAFYDECLDECLATKDEAAFEQIFYLITCENMPVNYMHSQKSISALMIAANKDFQIAVQNLLKLGAIPSLRNRDGVSAKTLALENGCVESLTLMVQYEIDHDGDGTMAHNSNAVAEADYNRAMQQFLATAYQITTARDEVNHLLISYVIQHVHANTPKDGSILVFLPGYDDILSQKDLVESTLVTRDFMLFVLHSGVGVHKEDQRQVFQKMPPGIRKIILATNIAETSITIDDVVYVIDAGLVKLVTYDSVSVTTCLSCTWVSQACAKQRSGRAGRTRNGICYRLYPIEHYEAMEKYTLPELLRVPLSDICLNAKILAGEMSIEEFLMKAVQPPPPLSIRQSISLLKSIGALDKEENVTDLGVHLVDFPVDAQLGKCLLYAVLLKCVDPVITIVSALSVRDPFALPTRGADSKNIDVARKKFARESFSDHQMLLNAFNDWFKERQCRSERKFANDNYIISANMELITGVRSQIFHHLESTGFISFHSKEFANFNTNSNDWSVVKACLTAAYYPNVCRINRKTGKLFAKHDRKMIPHRASVLRSDTKGIDVEFIKKAPTEWLIHGEKSMIATTSLVRNISPVSPLTVALFGGPINLSESCIEIIKQYTYDSDDNEVEVNEFEEEYDQPCNFCIDDWIVFNTEEEKARLIFSLRQKLNDILVRMIRAPKKFIASSIDRDVIQLLVTVLNREEDNTFATLPLPEPASHSINSSSYMDALNIRPQTSTGYASNNGQSGDPNNWSSGATNNGKARNLAPKKLKKVKEMEAEILLRRPPTSEQPSRSNVHESAPEVPRVATSDLPSPSIVFDALRTINESSARAVGSNTTNSAQTNGSPRRQSSRTPFNQNANLLNSKRPYKCFLLRVDSIDSLMETIYQRIWHFDMPIDALQEIEKVNPMQI